MIIHDLDLRYAGERVEGAGALNLIFLLVNRSEALLDLDDIRFSYDVTNITAGAKMVNLGPKEEGTHQFRGSIARAALLEYKGDPNPRVIQLEEHAHVEIVGILIVRECDFSRMEVGKPLTFADSGEAAEPLKAKVYMRDCRFFTMPVAAAAITVGASPFTYRNLDGYREQIGILGGAVTKVAVSRDRFVTSKELDPGATALVLDNGDSVRVTYTAAPTMHKTALG